MATLQQEYKQKDTFFRRWAAVILLFIFFAISWGGQFVTQLQTEINESKQLGQTLKMEEFWPQFWSSTLENWQSEWLQLFTQALIISAFASYIFRKGDQEHFKTQLMIEELRSEIKNKA